MTWYVAHAVYATTRIGVQDTTPVELEERLYLIEGDNSDIAYRKAEEIAKLESVGSRACLNGEAAEELFLGIRRLVTIRNAVDDVVNNEVPADKCELTYLHIQVSSLPEAKKYVNGEVSSVVVIE